MLYLHRPNRTTKRMRLGIHNEAARVKAEHDARRAVAGYIPRAGSEPEPEPKCQPDLFSGGPGRIFRVASECGNCLKNCPASCICACHLP